jgi:uncharacterized repeat protein (TIGR03803 family)
MTKLRMYALVLSLAVFGPLSAQAQSTPTFTVLYTFTGNADGANPNATMALDGRDNLYGTTQFGGYLDCNLSLHPGCGTVFRLDTGRKLTPLYTFPGPVGGGGVILDGRGNLDGVAHLENGQLYKLNMDGAYHPLYNFAGEGDGNLPTANLIRDSGGNLYGTTLLGGSFDPSCQGGCGTVFELESSGQHKVLYSFLNNADGNEPLDVIRDRAGNLFGITDHGGQGCPNLLGCGTVFKVDAAGRKTTLHAFTGRKDGSTPVGNLAMDAEGNLYGATTAGGDLSCPYNGGAGCGVLFKLDATGKETVLHAFHGGASDGAFPISVTLGAAGNLYGNIGQGPNPVSGQCGAIFTLDRSGNVIYLHVLNGNTEGCGPVGALIQDAAGNFYGTAALGGDLNNPNVCFNGCGTVFKIKP